MRFLSILVCATFITSCGGGSGSSDNGSTSSTTGQSNMAVGIHLPSGFTYDPATGIISGEFARAGVSNPKAYVGQAYITQIDVTRTGGTLASQTISLTGSPPATSASFTVTPGEAYNYSAAIYTSQPPPWDVMSGGTLSPVTAPADGQTNSADIYISGVNGVPVVTFTADNMNPDAGTANLTCTSVDPDADPVTYLVKTVAPPAGANALSNTNPTPGNAIAYTTGVASQVDLECVATDSYGAIGYASLSLNSGATTVVAPSAPTGVTAVGADAQVTVSWSASTGATSYNLYWSATPGVTTASNKIGGGTSPYVHAGLTNGAAYYYAITAVNAVGESGLSPEVNATPTAALTAPSAPTGVSAVGADAQVTVSWGASTGATSYNLYWSATPVTTASTKIAGVTSSYIHTPLTNGIPYYYAVTAVNVAGESGLSVEVNATPQAAVVAPIAPTGVTAVGANTQVTISWSASVGATSYNLYWDTAPGVTTASNMIPVGASPYSHIGRTNGTPYYYAVTAVNTAGESGISAEVSATPGVTGVPTNLVVSPGSAQNRLLWDTVAGATSYNVYFNTTGNVTIADTKIATVNSPYNHTVLSNGSTYYYAVSANGAAGESALSTEITGTPMAFGVFTQRFAMANLMSGAYANDIYVVTGYDGNIYRSLDGVNWNVVAHGMPATGFTNILHDGTQFVVFGNNLTVYYTGFSGDGLTWTWQSTVEVAPSAAYTTGEVEYALGQYWAPRCCGTLTGPAIFNSLDAVTWIQEISWGQLNCCADRPSVFAIAFGGGKIVAVGDTGNALRSLDNGVTWTGWQVNGTIRNVQHIDYGAGRFVAVGPNTCAVGGMILHSSDAVNWTVINYASPVSPYDVRYINAPTPYFFAFFADYVGNCVSVGPTGYYATSADGITWTATTAVGFRVSGGIEAIFESDNKIVLIAIDGIYTTSK